MTKPPKRPQKAKPPFKTVDDLATEALAILEQRGFAVRGKTTAEIHEIIKRAPTKPKRNA